LEAIHFKNFLLFAGINLIETAKATQVAFRQFHS